MPFPYRRKPTDYSAPDEDYVTDREQEPPVSWSPSSEPDYASTSARPFVLHPPAPPPPVDDAAPAPDPTPMPAPPPIPTSYGDGALAGPPIARPTPPKTGPTGPPPIGEEEKAYRAMMQIGPRKSTLGRIAAGAIGAAAGYVNAAGRSHVNVDPAALDRMKNRNPIGSGSYAQGLERQKELASEERGDAARQTAWENQQIKNESERKQGGYYDAHAASVTQDSATKAKAETDKVEIEKQKREAAAKRQKALLDSNKQAITIKEANDHGLYVSPEDMDFGYVIVDRKTYTPIAKTEATPDRTKHDINYWNSLKVSSAPGSKERLQAEEAIKGLTEYAKSVQPPRAAKVADPDKATTRKSKEYVGRLEAQSNGDWKQVMATIRADKSIDDATRAAAMEYAMKQARLGREPKAAKDWKKEAMDMVNGSGPAPPSGGGTQAGPAPVAMPRPDPMNVR